MLVALLWIFIALSTIVLSFARESRVEVVAIRKAERGGVTFVQRFGARKDLHKIEIPRLRIHIPFNPDRDVHLDILLHF